MISNQGWTASNVTSNFIKRKTNRLWYLQRKTIKTIVEGCRMKTILKELRPWCHRTKREVRGNKTRTAITSGSACTSNRLWNMDSCLTLLQIDFKLWNHIWRFACFQQLAVPMFAPSVLSCAGLRRMKGPSETKRGRENGTKVKCVTRPAATKELRTNTKNCKAFV